MKSIHEYANTIRKGDYQVILDTMMSLRKHLNSYLKQLIEAVERDKAIHKQCNAAFAHITTFYAFVQKIIKVLLDGKLPATPTMIADTLDDFAIICKESIVCFTQQRENEAVYALASNLLEQKLFS